MFSRARASTAEAGEGRLRRVALRRRGHGAQAPEEELLREGLRQEENQYLQVPRALAETYPETIQRLLGYQSHGLVGGHQGPEGTSRPRWNRRPASTSRCSPSTTREAHAHLLDARR